MTQLEWTLITPKEPGRFRLRARNGDPIVSTARLVRLEDGVLYQEIANGHFKQLPLEGECEWLGPLPVRKPRPLPPKRIQPDPPLGRVEKS